MTYKEIQDLVKLLNKSELSEFKLKNGDFEISIRTKNYSKTRHIESVIPAQSMAPPIYTIPEAPTNQALVDNNADTPSSTGEAPNSNLIEIKSPMVGTFYRSASPENPPFAKIGDVISEGETVCIIEAMKLFNEIESEVTGKIVKVLVENASPIEYDQVLFLVDPNA